MKSTVFGVLYLQLLTISRIYSSIWTPFQLSGLIGIRLTFSHYTTLDSANRGREVPMLFPDCQAVYSNV